MFRNDQSTINPPIAPSLSQQQQQHPCFQRISTIYELPSVHWRCWLGGRKGIWPVKTQWWGAGVVICLERGADLHMAQLMPLPLTVFCSSKIQIGFTFWYRLTRVVPDKRPLYMVVCVFNDIQACWAPSWNAPRQELCKTVWQLKCTHMTYLPKQPVLIHFIVLCSVSFMLHRCDRFLIKVHPRF